VIAGRVLSNWYPIEEGILLHGSIYDSTEHFWQAVKYHPDTTVAELKELIVFAGGPELELVAETVGRRSQDLFAECIRCGISEIKTLGSRD